jgi:predicted aldo/keto reductase-like oxidoreductase
MPYRTLGKTGENVSLLGVGGAHIGRGNLTDEESVRLMRTAVDEGVNFFDNAYIYSNGRSEERMGTALRDGYREKVFLMTKHYTRERDVESARQQLETSLRRLQTDHVDLWQIHQVREPNDAQVIYDNGIMDMMEKARDEGKIRYIGFTGHTRPEYHVEMIDRGYPWDAVQMPVNPLDYQWDSFIQMVMSKAREKNIAVLAMKPMAGTPGSLVNEASQPLSAEECLRFAMSQPVATVISGMDSMEYLQQNLETAKTFRSLDEEAVASILEKTEQLAEGGDLENYKRKQS